MMVLGISPFIGLFLSWWVFAIPLGNGSWRRGLLRTSVLWGLYSVITLEFLSMFNVVTRPALMALWFLPITALLALKVQELRQRGRIIRNFDWIPMGLGHRVLFLLLISVVLITLLVAWLSPPSTWDSLNYHMPRVAHWAQMEAVKHYATGIEIQNSMPPASEMMILHNYVLSKSDRWVNFIAWVSVWTGIIGVTWLASQLGASRRGQWLSAAFAASLPTAQIQASSTMTDAVVALWVIVVGTEAIPLLKGEKLTISGALFMSASAGLAILTKPISFAYLLPFAIFVGYSILRNSGWRRTLLFGLMAVLIVGGINAGHWSRNQALYGNPISHPSRLEAHRAPWLGGRAFLSNLVRNVAMHTATPSPHINKGITLVVQEFHDLIDLPVNDSRTTATGRFKIRWGETNEDKATNPIHAYLILLVLIGLLLKPTPDDSPWRHYTLLVIFTLITFSLLFQWQLFGGRYHLPLFMLFAPIVGIVVSSKLSARWAPLLGITLVMFSWPWLFQIKSRPIIVSPQDSYVSSILTTPRQELYLANADYLSDPLSRFSRVLTSSSCHDIGLVLRGGAPEYLWWVWLGAPRSEVRMHWIVAGAPSGPLMDPDLEVCSVICRDCDPDQSSFRTKGLVEKRSNFSLYLANGGS